MGDFSCIIMYGEHPYFNTFTYLFWTYFFKYNKLFFSMFFKDLWYIICFFVRMFILTFKQLFHQRIREVMAVLREMFKTVPAPPTQNRKKIRRNFVQKTAACEIYDFISTKNYDTIRNKSCA